MNLEDYLDCKDCQNSPDMPCAYHGMVHKKICNSHHDEQVIDEIEEGWSD